MISIDHHPGSDLPADFSWCEPKASSTGEILASLFLDEINIPQQACACWYYAILADTNGFQFPNTSARTLELAARLVSKGAHPDQLANLFFNRWSERDIRYFARAMSSLECLEGMACACLPFESGVGEEYDSDILMNEWRRWPDPIVYALFKETEPQHFKVSLRSHGTVDVSQVARLFHGGGHAAASCCRLEGDYRQVQQRLLEAFRELLKDA
jgi:phosphoesterase RecJ-like protein